MKKLSLTLILFFNAVLAFGTGEPSTYFNIYVPPNNDAVQRNVALIITAINDSTTFTIVDDSADGDNDDCVQGMLMAGQSYILYIKDNGINDDARYASGGVLKRDGDYFTIQSSKLVYASISTDSDWQHDWVPGTDKKSVSKRFLVYSPRTTFSNRDLNVFAYHDSTTINVWKISSSSTQQTGYTNISWSNKTLAFTTTLNPGQDIIYHSSLGRNVMESGASYLIESNKPISVQYGALFQNERDGGGQVPASNGTSAGELFYFAVPYQAGGEQEIRVLSWQDSNEVDLFRYSGGSWVAMSSWNLNTLESGEWVGKSNGNVSYPTVFKLQCSSGKKVSVMEANWMETGSVGTSDMSTMLSSESGSSSGKRFVAYMAPPGHEHNVVDPFTGNFFSGSMTHLYLFASSKNATVSVKDAKTGGQVFSRTYTIDAGRYADCALNLNEWKSIYNGTGSPSGSDRPYLLVESDVEISVMNTNFNDNWMMYFGSSLTRGIQQESQSDEAGIPGDTLNSVNYILSEGTDTLSNSTIEQTLSSGLVPISSVLNSQTSSDTGVVSTDSTGSKIVFNSNSTIAPGDTLQVSTVFKVSPNYNNGDPVSTQTVLSIETRVSAEVNGQIKESVSSDAIAVNTLDQHKLRFESCYQSSTQINDSWNACWTDYNQDGLEDLYILTKDKTSKNILLRNNGDSTFTRITQHPLISFNAKSVSANFIDIDNDGDEDVMVVNAAEMRSILFKNTGNNYQEVIQSGLPEHPKYFHGALWIDYDKDQLPDLILTNFFQTEFHQIYHNEGNFKFTRIENTPISKTSHRSTIPLAVDANNDGLSDLYICNGNAESNSLYINLGNGNFEEYHSTVLDQHQDNTVSAAWGDYNNDGWVDLFVSNSSGQANRLYKNLGNLNFSYQPDAGVCSDGGHSHAARFNDLNNDGYLDLFVCNDNGANFLYYNNGDGTFSREKNEALAGNLGKSIGQSWSDINHDGALDLVISTHNQEKDHFFCGKSGQGNYLSIKLAGITSQKNGLGARVYLYTQGKMQFRQHYPYGGMGSNDSYRIHFGLDTCSKADSILIYWPSGIIQKEFNISANQFVRIEEQSAFQVQAKVYHDLNANCQKDSNEEFIKGISLWLNNQNKIGPDPLGIVRLNLAEGTYTIKPDSSAYWYALCTNTLSIDSNNQTSSIEIPCVSGLSSYDLDVNGGTTAWRRGFKNQTSITCLNKGNLPAYRVKIKLNYPSDVGIIQANLPFTQNLNEYVWAIDTLQSGESLSIQIIDSVGLNAIIGQTMQLNASAFADNTDADTSNNYWMMNNEIVGAIDPNDILVNPHPYVEANGELFYKIRFQNVGNYLAENIRITDQLPAELDFKSIQFIGSSHEGHYEISQQGKLNYYFDGIQLPDSNSDEANSHGFIEFRIQLKEGLAAGTEISNFANIYFDYEEAVKTNTVRVRVQTAQANAKLEIMPNPNNGKFKLKLYNPDFTAFYPYSISNYRLYDQGARLLQSGKIPESHTVDFSHLSNGMYILQVVDEAGFKHQSILIIQQ